MSKFWNKFMFRRVKKIFVALIAINLSNLENGILPWDTSLQSVARAWSENIVLARTALTPLTHVIIVRSVFFYVHLEIQNALLQSTEWHW